MKHIGYYSEGYPRPQLYRSGYAILNGEWDFAFDPEGNMDDICKGGFRDQMKIQVPYPYQTELSGIGRKDRVDTVWYSRSICLTEEQLAGDVLLHLEGCDYETTVYVNGSFVGSDTGAYHRLSFDLTEHLQTGENKLVIRAADDYSVEKPRGKQRWKDENFECWYVDTTGIYKTAWLEYVPHTRIGGLRIDTDRCAGTATFTLQTNNVSGGERARIEITLDGEPVADRVVSPDAPQTVVLTEKQPLKLWDAGAPNLYEAKITLEKDGEVIDRVETYFGVREIAIDGQKVLLNGKPLYQKLVLDQGYWEGGDLTAPNEAALLKDITDMMAMGFNGARKHQKMEDERFLYYADILGYIVWAEMPSMYCNSEKSRPVFQREWMLSVKQQHNHPCVLVWVPFNESWGIEEIRTDKTVQAFVNDTYNMTKAWDGSRPVITNDGWEHTVSDILTIHHYEQDGEKLHSYFDTIEKCVMDVWQSHHKGAFAEGYGYRGQPVMISEFGGTAYVKDTHGANWGYGQGVQNDEEFLRRFAGLIDAIDSIPFMAGYCYTQVTDVQQEVNGLLYYNHEPKFPHATIKAILDKSGR